MRINLQNCIDNQKNLDFHPKFWEKPTSEIIAKLEQHYETCLERIQELGDRDDLCIHGRVLLASSLKFVEIATAQQANSWCINGRDFDGQTMEAWC